MNWKGRRVLVTGAGGFIGSHLVERLVMEGAAVRALVHYNSLGSWGWLDASPARQGVEVIAGDVCDRDSVDKAVQTREIVFHLAALIAIPYSYRAPSSFVRTNIEGTLHVLQAVLAHQVECMVHTSTSEVYGTARYVPMDEAHPLQGQSPYAASKIGADKMAEAFHRSFAVPVVTVRPFNTFGPRQSDRAVIPTIISQCLTSNRVTLGSVHASRDFNFVANTVEGFLRAASTPAAVGQTINLGSGREITIDELTRVISRLTGKSVTIEQSKDRVRPEASEVERLLASADLAEKLLGWRPQVDLEDGLRRTIDWMTNNLTRYRPGVYVV